MGLDTQVLAAGCLITCRGLVKTLAQRARLDS